MGWLFYGAIVLAISVLIGSHLGRFREAYTEMTGMMAGMTMGMLNGFLLGYSAAAATNSMFWGNAFGIMLGLALGAFFGRAGGLMGIMDGAMGGVMGGSMGAMLAVMVVFPREGLFWTAALLGVIYIAGMVGLVVLIEQSAPGHEALHRLMPLFTRAVATEASEEAEAVSRRASSKSTTSSKERTMERRLVNYYDLLDVYPDALDDEIEEAYLEKLESANDAMAERLERAVIVLTNPQKRRAYDLKLGQSVPAVASSYNRATVRTAPQNAPTHEQVTARPAGTGRSSYGSGNGAAGAIGNGSSSARPQGQGYAQQTAVQARTAQNSKRTKSANAAKGNKERSRQQVRYTRTPQPVQQNTALSISWVTGLVVALVILALGWWAMSGSTGAGARVPSPNSEAATQLEAQAVVAPIGADGKQTLDLVINSNTISYEPSVIKVKQGVPVRFNLSIKGPDPG